MSREAARAATAERFARQRQERIEDVEFLLDNRTDPNAIPDRLGLSPAALAKSLHRAGRPDLARHFWRATPRNDTPGECRYCGEPTSRSVRTACAGCRNYARNETINARSQCKNGHEFTPGNTYIKPDPPEGRRACRECRAAANRRYFNKKKEATT